MPPRPRRFVLAAGLLALMSPEARAGTITDFLDRIGGCRKPMSDSFSYEISPYTPKPYGKALAEWTNQDLAEFRAFFVTCQTHRHDWPSLGEGNRAYEIQLIDTAMAELRGKVADARGKAERQQAEAAYDAERRQREQDQQSAQAQATAQRAASDQAAQAEQAQRSQEARQKVLPLLRELLAFTENELGGLTPEQKLTRFDGFIARMDAVGREVADTPSAKPLMTMLEQTRALRDQLAVAQARQAPVIRDEQEAGGRRGSDGGPYTDFEVLGQRVVMAMTNPLQRDDFRASLVRGIDFNVGVSAIEPSPTGWLVQLSGRPGVSGRPGQGFFCRVDRTDGASLAVLRTVTPPYGIIHVAAPGTEAFMMESTPLQARIVFGPCQVTPPSGD